MDITVDAITSVAEDIEKITSAYKTIMFPDNFGAEVELPPELSLAFGEFADACEDFIMLFDFYNKRLTPEEEAADLEANYIIAKDHNI